MGKYLYSISGNVSPETDPFSVLDELSFDWQAGIINVIDITRVSNMRIENGKNLLCIFIIIKNPARMNDVFYPFGRDSCDLYLC